MTLSIDNLLKIYKENPEKMEGIFSLVKSLDAEKDPERAYNFARIFSKILQQEEQPNDELSQR